MMYPQEGSIAPRPDQKERCYFCGADVHEGDSPATNPNYCHGCGEYVCDSCDETGPMGFHDVMEHQLADNPA